jgi:hypothetical protein
MPEPYECPYAGLSPKVQIFLHEVEGLCRGHGLALGSSGYDELQIWPLEEGEPALSFYQITDETGGDASTHEA